MAIEPLILLLIEKVLNGVVRYNGKKYFAKEPSGKYLSFSEMRAFKRGLYISIPAVTKLAFLYKKSGSFFKTMQEYMIKFNRLLTSKNIRFLFIKGMYSRKRNVFLQKFLLTFLKKKGLLIAIKSVEIKKYKARYSVMKSRLKKQKKFHF